MTKQARRKEDWGMNNGKATAIFNDIYRPGLTDNERGEAIKDVLDMETHNGITKESMLDVIKYLWHMVFVEDEGSTEPCEDCISRQELLGIIGTVCFSRDWSKFRVDYGSNGTRDYIINYIKQMPSVQPEQRWIPVSERLPETDTDVLVTNGIGTYVGWIDPEDKDWRVDSVIEYFMKDIVAWMPLPEPYKAESEGEK